jgi:hypothetical protein
MPHLDRSGAEPLPGLKPSNLVKFAIMGCVFSEDVLWHMWGNDVSKEAFKLVKSERTQFSR